MGIVNNLNSTLSSVLAAPDPYVLERPEMQRASNRRECPVCKKVCLGKRGLKAHARFCQGEPSP